MASNNTTSSSPSFIIELQVVSRYLSLSSGFFFFVTGILGNSLNVVIFCSLGHYKNNPCSLYMLAKALLELGALFVGLGTRILAAGFQIDWALSSRPWCKLRRCWITMNNIISFSLLSVQSIDVFFCSSSSVALRRKSNIRYARRIVVGILAFGFLHSLPFFFYQDMVVTATGAIACNTINVAYNQYQLYFINLCLYVAIPVAVTSVFGLLIYRNVHSINVQQQRRTLSLPVRQMIRMSLYNMVIVIVFVTPYGVIQLYALLTSGLAKTASRVAQEQVVSTFSTIYFYGAFSVS
jgi:hypothetical protein